MKQNISVNNNDSQICQAKSTAINFNGDEDSLFFNCDICRADKYSNLDAEINDVFISANGDNFNIRTLVHSTNVEATNVNVTVKAQSKKTGLIVDESDYIIPNVSGVKDYNATVTLDLSEIDYLHIYIDPNDDVKDEDATDNYILVPVVKDKLKANLSINTGYSKVDDAIKNYLKFFVDDKPRDETDLIISIGKNTSEVGNYNDDTKVLKPASFTIKGRQIKTNSGEVDNPYAGIVGNFYASDINDNIVFIYGNRIEGTVSALKGFISARKIFARKQIPRAPSSIPKGKLVILDDYDANAIGVFDLFHNDENKNYFMENTDDFADVVTDILNGNNFEISIKTVKTLNTTSYNQSTILRLKYVNSDYSDNYKDAVVNNSKPVVFGAGLWGSLSSLNDFATELATDSENARNSWLIEITGGPKQECDTCPDYTYNDLVDYYWPALIAGVEKYSGENQVDYIGHSNGGRPALSSLNKYSAGGKETAGYCFNLDTGKYDVGCDLSSNPVNKFIGIAIPATLNDNTDFTSAVRHIQCYAGYCLSPAGNLSIQSIDERGLAHIRKFDFTQPLFWHTPINLYLSIQYVSSAFENEKISRNLMNFYNNIALNNDTILNLSGVNVNKLYLVNTQPHDVIVGAEDQTRIFEAVTAIADDDKISLNYTGTIQYHHGGIFKQYYVIRDIKEALK